MARYIDMKRILLMICLTAGWLVGMAQDEITQPEVVLETDSGVVRVKLYNETPLHRDNFLKLVKSGFYDGLLFHRVIDDFMIQTGDSVSRNAPEGKLLGDGSYEKYKIPSEICFPKAESFQASEFELFTRRRNPSLRLSNRCLFRCLPH